MVGVGGLNVLETYVIDISAYLSANVSAEIHVLFQRAEERHRFHGYKGAGLHGAAYADTLHKVRIILQGTLQLKPFKVDVRVLFTEVKVVYPYVAHAHPHFTGPCALDGKAALFRGG